MDMKIFTILHSKNSVYRDQIYDFYPLAQNSKWSFFLLDKDDDQLAIIHSTFRKLEN